MKNIFMAIFILAIFLQGCYEDKGNYDYLVAEEVAPIIASELDEAYDATSLEQFVLDPVVEDDGDYMEYLWFIYPTTNANLPNDTIGHERKLDYLVTAQSGTYQLVFKVTDTRYGTSAYQQARLNVASTFSTGYYVMKYENDRTDVDFVDKEGALHILLEDGVYETDTNNGGL